MNQHHIRTCHLICQHTSVGCGEIVHKNHQNLGQIPEEVDFNVLEVSTNTKIMTSCDTLKHVELNHILTIPRHTFFRPLCCMVATARTHALILISWPSCWSGNIQTWHTWPTVCHMSISHMLGVIESTFMILVPFQICLIYSGTHGANNARLPSLPWHLFPQKLRPSIPAPGWRCFHHTVEGSGIPKNHMECIKHCK